MSTDKASRSKQEENKKIDVSWRALITHAESEINASKDKIKKLSKSIVFFKIQDSLGVPFPLPDRPENTKIS